MPCHLFVILVNVKMLGKNEYLKKNNITISQSF